MKNFDNRLAAASSHRFRFSNLDVNRAFNRPVLDSIPAAAAFGLRKLSTDYPGAAVRIRRASDNAETDIFCVGDAVVKYPLDLLNAHAAAGFGLRRLSANYNGPCIRVRATVSADELDIGFVGDDLDTATLLTFAGVNGAAIVTWYDQSGNNKHLAGPAVLAEKPRIVVTGALVVTSTGLPSISFNGVSQKLFGTAAATALQGHIVLQSQNVGTSFEYLAGGSNVFAFRRATSTRCSGVFGGVVNDYTETNGDVLGVYTDLASISRKNGTGLAPTSSTLLASSSVLVVGARDTSNYFFGKISELILLTNESSAGDRVRIEQSQAFYYQVTYASQLPPLVAGLAQTRRNLVANPTASGAVVGTTTLPTGWSMFPLPSGISYLVDAAGSELGLPYVDIRLYGTAAATGTVRLVLSGPSFITVTPNTPAVATIGWRHVGGTFNGLGSNSLVIINRALIGTFLSNSSVNGSPTTSYYRVGLSVILGAATYRASLEYNVLISAGTPVDYTIRLYVPNFELGHTVSARPLLTNLETVVSPVGGLDIDAVESFVSGLTQLVSTAPITTGVTLSNTSLTNNTWSGALTEDALLSAHQVKFAVPLSSTGVSITLWAARQTGSRNLYIELQTAAATYHNASIDLGTGAVVAVTLPITISATAEVRDSVSGWLITAAVPSTTLLGLLTVDMTEGVNRTYTGDGVSSVLLRDVQVFTLTGTVPAYVTKWYDQSGNIKDVSQASITDQPVLVESKHLKNTTTFKPTIYFPGGTACLFNAATVSAMQGHVVAEQTSAVTNTFEYCAGSPGIYGNWVNSDRRAGYYDAVLQSGGLYAVPVDGLTTVYCDRGTTTTTSMRRNGEDVQFLSSSGLSTAPTRLEVGARNSASGYVGNIAELILLANQTETLQRSVIENNQLRFFSVPVA